MIPGPYRPKQLNPPPGRGRSFNRTWSMVDGALRDAMIHHPDYFTRKGASAVSRGSLVKRITGLIASQAEQSARGRSGGRLPASAGG